jgi:hypothetical protein
MSLDKLFKGFTEEKEDPAYPEIPPFPREDLADYRPDIDAEAKTEADPVRTIIDGALDFLGHVTEEVTEWIERETGDGHRPRAGDAKPLILRTADMPATDWSTRRYTVPIAGSIPLVTRRPERRMVRLVNFGPDPVYIAHETPPVIIAPDLPPNVMSMPVSSLTVAGQYWPIVWETTDEIWARVGAGIASVVEVTEFYGISR